MNTLVSLRPRNVTVAVVILCAVLACRLVSGVVGVAYAASVSTVIRDTAYVGGVLAVCINAFFVYKIFRGRNWARIVYLVFFLLGIAVSIHHFTAFFGRSPTLAVVSLVSRVAEIVALVLLFTRASNTWFRPQSA